MRRALPLLLAACATLAAAPLAAAPCKDAKGKFVACPKPAAAKPMRCKNAKGHFAKCGTPGAKPM